MNHGDGFKDDLDRVIAFKEFIVQQEKEGKNINNFNITGTQCTPTVGFLWREGRGFLAGAFREEFGEEVTPDWVTERGIALRKW